MGRNILIFSDGTGQGGGVLVDERRSNVYKLYRASRCGPDSTVDPAEQLAFYDPGLGSRAADGGKVGLWRRLYNVASQATGLGLTRNIVDCYAAVLRMWEPGDRIYLFGFSRGAYTVRCLSGVLSLCGVPTRMKDGSPLRRDPDSAQAIAAEAVKSVYQYGSGVRDDALGPERRERARAFREAYGSDRDGGPNAAPYLIGVWDTVAALGLPLTGPMLVAAAVVVLLVGIAALAALVRFLLWSGALGTMATGTGFLGIYGSLLVLAVLATATAFAWNYVYWPVRSGPYRRGVKVASTLRMKFYDRTLGSRVAFARHALSIDEDRLDFERVTWKLEPGAASPGEGLVRLRQVWFAGNHSDVGGSYDENESRLSDIALKWMVDEARALPEPLRVNEAYLRLFPSSAGPQHDEARSGFAGLPPFLRGLLRWKTLPREIKPNAPLHPSVLERFALSRVRIYDMDVPYRPTPLREHGDVARHYGAS